MSDSQRKNKPVPNRWTVTYTTASISLRARSALFSQRFCDSTSIPGTSSSGNRMSDLISSFAGIFVVVAHEDDHTACSVILQGAREAQVVVTTDGALPPSFSGVLTAPPPAGTLNNEI